MKLFPTLGYYSGESNDAYVMPFSLENPIIGQAASYVPVKQEPIAVLNAIPVKPIIQSAPVITTGAQMMYNDEVIVSTPRPLQNEVVTVTNTPLAVIPIKGQVLQTQQTLQATNNEAVVIPSNNSMKITSMLIDVLGKAIAFANIAVNGVPTAQTNASGIVTIANLKPTDILTFSYIGYETQTFVASQIPEKITLKEGSIMLDDVAITPTIKPKPTKKTNWFLLLLLGGGTAYVINKASKSEKKPKKVTAKI